MAKICLWLPPFAGDYSGVCSALFDLGGLICIHDASGCTGNYTHFDEPRWYGSSSMVFCSNYRKMDAVLGNDEHIMQRIEKAAADMHPKFIALVGSPVPNVVGFDFNGVARALEKRTGIPCFGFATMGIQGSYKDGVVMAVKALTERFASDAKDEKAEYDPARTVNILGATPLDLDIKNYRELCGMLKNEGYLLRCTGDDYGSIGQLRHPAAAAVSLAWNQAGLELAQYAEKRFGLPYLAGFPIGEKNRAIYFEKLEQCIKTRQSANFVCRGNQSSAGEKICILNDALIGSAIADYLDTLGYAAQVHTIFGKSPRMEDFCSDYLHHEDGIVSCLEAGGFDTMIADPVILDLYGNCLEADSAPKTIPLPLHAVSSRVNSRQSWLFTKADSWKEILSGCV